MAGGGGTGALGVRNVGACGKILRAFYCAVSFCRALELGFQTLRAKISPVIPRYTIGRLGPGPGPLVQIDRPPLCLNSD
jgi:hypothetical protein